MALLAAPPAIFKSRSVAVLGRTHRNCGTEQVLKPWRPLKALSPPGGTVPKALRVTPPTPGGSLEATNSPGTAGGAAAPALGQEESAAGAPKPPCSPQTASPKALWQPTGRQQALGPKARADSSGETPPSLPRADGGRGSAVPGGRAGCRATSRGSADTSRSRSPALAEPPGR